MNLKYWVGIQTRRDEASPAGKGGVMLASVLGSKLRKTTSEDVSLYFVGGTGPLLRGVLELRTAEF